MEERRMKPLTATQEKMRVKKLTAIKADLLSNDEDVVLKAIKGVKDHGDASVIEPLLLVLNRMDDLEVQREIRKLLFSLKDNKTVPELIRLASTPAYSEHGQLLLSAIWESGLDASEQFTPLIELAKQANYEQLIEIMTIVDQIALGEDQAENEEAIRVLTEHIAKHAKDERSQLWVSMTQQLTERLVG